MTSLALSFVTVGIALLIPVPFLKEQRVRRSLAILSLMVFGVLGMTLAMQAARSPALNLSVFVGAILLFWLAGRFESS